MPELRSSPTGHPPGRGGLKVAAVAAVLLVALVSFLLVELRREDADVPATISRTAAEQEATPAVEIDLPPLLASEANAQPLTPTDFSGLGSASSEAAAVADHRFAVQVIDVEGHPIADATVVVRVDTETVPYDQMMKLMAEGSSQPSGIDIETIRADLKARRKIAAEGPPSSYVSDSEGRCHFTAPASIVVHAEKDDVGTSGEWRSTPRFSLKRRNAVFPADAERHLTLTLQPQATIEGRVVDVQGEPMLKARVIGEPGFSATHTSPRRPEEVMTDERGAFALRVDAPSDFTLHAEIGPERTAVERVSAAPGGRKSVELRMKGAFHVRGRVMDPKGKHISGVRLTLKSELSLEFSSSAADGSFDFPLADAVSYELTASAQGLAADRVTVWVSPEQPVADVVIQMKPGGSIAGTVRWDDGTPVAMANVRAVSKSTERPLDPWSDMAFSAGKGRFSLDGLEPGERYDVTATVVAPALAMAVRQDVATGTLDLDLVLQRQDAAGFKLIGRVVDAGSGRPITSYTLEYGLWIRGLYGGESMQVDDQAGRFELAGLNRFEQALVVRAFGYPPKTVGPVTLSDPPVELLIRLEHCGDLLVRTVDESGTPVADVQVHLDLAVSEEQPDLFEDSKDSQSDPSGETRWSELPAGRCVVQAQKGALLSDMTFATLAGEQVTTVTVTLRSSLELGSLDVTVRDAAGRLVEGAPVSVRNITGLGLGQVPGVGEAREFESPTDLQGKALFSGLLPGRYWVWPNLEGGWAPPAWVTVSAGRSTVVELAPE